MAATTTAQSAAFEFPGDVYMWKSSARPAAALGRSLLYISAFATQNLPVRFAEVERGLRASPAVPEGVLYLHLRRQFTDLHTP